MLTNLEAAPRDPLSFLYGTLQCGADTWQDTLGKGQQIFSYDSRLRGSDQSHRTNYYRTKWDTYPQLDLLIVMDDKMDKFHEHWMTDWGRPSRARHILVFHGLQFLTSYGGKGFKSWGKAIKSRGYGLHTWHIDATRCGGSLWSNYVVTFCFPEGGGRSLPAKLGDDNSLRPCRNLIRTYGVHRSKYQSHLNLLPSSSPHHNNLVGTLHGHVVYDWEGPCCGMDMNSWIQIPEFGIRHILPDEMRKLKGVQNSRYNSIPSKVLFHSVEQHVWAVICKAIAPCLIQTPPMVSPASPSTKDYLLHQPPIIGKNRNNTLSSTIVQSNWTWTMPNLTTGSPFNLERIKSLKTALKESELDYETEYQAGLDILTAHQKNYGPEGPLQLVVLWWEWPSLHWENLRTGSPMNFMEVPTPGLIPNQVLKGPELDAAIKFVDELISLQVLILPPPSVTVLNYFPLFLVPKPGQPGQFRTIADGKAGGQNEVCVADPCLMTSPEYILAYLYTNGFSATLDLSKYFHMFLTRVNEQKYMGLQHPGTDATYVYNTFPMGTRNSPGASGRFGAAFLRTVMDTSELFHGTPTDNSFKQYFLKKTYHPSYGEGRILIGADGLPVVLIWIHVDDILIHAPTLSKLQRALDHIMHTTIRLGLICHPDKTSPPSQRVKFCGFIYDTSATPALHIPQSKVSRAIAITTYLLSKASWPRLLVSMVVGYLQSLVPATPGNIGAALLRPIYFDLHKLNTTPTSNTKQAYFTLMDLSERSRVCLQWWIDALSCGLHHQSQPTDVSTLGVAWGDGSGTGAGGTFNSLSPHIISEVVTLDVWKGVWSPHVGTFSSNWKEMRTLLQSLNNEKILGGTRIRNRRLLYFTDNMVTYDVFRRGSSKSTPLWKLYLQIKLLEIELSCHLQVLHVPGTTMILQGTDGLSRGVDMQILGSYKSNTLIPLLWRSAPPTKETLHWALSVLPPLWASSTQWVLHSDLSDWSRTPMLRQSVLWCISPSFARQAILHALSVWVECPTDSGHLFLVPRMLQRDFGRLSKFVLFGGQFSDLPLPFIPLVPFVLYYIPPFDRSTIYAKQRLKHEQQLDSPPIHIPSWIQQQIDSMQRLSLAV